MWCDSQFSAFSDLLKLDATRRARIDSAINAFTGFCDSDPQLNAAAAGKPFLQGSVATDTAIRPLKGDEFDVDVIYPFNLTAFPAGTTAGQITQWFLSRLKGNAFYKERLIPKDRCARINYSGDFHVDIIPSTPELSAHQPYAVPARDLASWVTNNPAAFQQWVTSRDRRGGGLDSGRCGYLVRSIRIMKRWRDALLPADDMPSSMLLVTFLGNHDPAGGSYSPPLQNPLFPAEQHQAAFLYDLLRLTFTCLEGSAGRLKPFENPVIPGEDLSRGWQQKHLESFLPKLGACIKHVGEGIKATTIDSATMHYKAAFGGTFPGP